jgi:hypothetical protein
MKHEIALGSIYRNCIGAKLSYQEQVINSPKYHGIIMEPNL